MALPTLGYHGGSYSPDGVEPISPVSSPSLTHDKGLPKHLEELDKSHLEGDLRHKQPGRLPHHSLKHPTYHHPVREGSPSPHHTGRKTKGTGDGGVGPTPQLTGSSWVSGMRPQSGTHLSHPSSHGLNSSALSAGPGKLSGEAAHLSHLRPLPESQSSSSPLLQTTPGVKGHQRVVTLAQHISVTTPSLPPLLIIFEPGPGHGPGEGSGRVTHSSWSSG